nr:hypothetical protein BaRGS_009937 [Batillaria attramentaria]
MTKTVDRSDNTLWQWTSSNGMVEDKIITFNILCKPEFNETAVETNISVSVGQALEMEFPVRKADWTLFETLTDTYTKPVNIRQKDTNKMVQDFTKAVLKAAIESIPRGARKDYKPYWTEELQNLEDAVTEARDQAEKQPSLENNIALKEATARYKLSCAQAARKSWQEKTESLNLDKDGSKLWKLARTLSNETTSHTKVTIQENGNHLSGKKAADHFIDIYETISNLEVPPEHRAAMAQGPRSTEDQITFITQSIEDAFQEKKNTLAVWIDMEKAFDKVWKDGLRLKLRRYDDIIRELPRGVRGAIYADDLVLWCSEEYTTTAQTHPPRLYDACSIQKEVLADTNSSGKPSSTAPLEELRRTQPSSRTPGCLI